MFKSKTFIYVLLIVLVGSIFVSAEEKKFASQFSKEEMFVYQKLPSYSEAPDLAKLVAEGQLPPLNERLPKEPRVIKTNIMVDGIGEYGGVWRDTFAVPIESWNWGAGKTQGWFGICQMVQESLIKTGPMWMLKEPDPIPNLAREWEWSEDGKTLTMYLIEGAKWSDGEPFTADDVMFTYYDYILDDNIPSWAGTSAWTYGGKVTELEKVDDYTIRWHFGIAFPIHALYNMGYLNFSVVPKHVYENFHPKYNEAATYDELLTATPPDDLPAVTLGPWVPVAYEPGQQLIMVRNPYYWQVDEKGQQLPYLDEVWFSEAESGDVRDMNFISEITDRTNLENPQVFSLVNQAALKEGANIRIAFGPFGIGYRLIMNFSKYRGVDSEQDLQLRELFRDLTFREVISRAIDRKAVANAAFPGPLTQEWYGGYPSGSAYYRDDLVTKYEYEPVKARTLLSSLGFEDTDGDGIVNWSETSVFKGQNLILEVIVPQDQAASVEAAEALQIMFRDVGIDLRVKTGTSPSVDSRIDAGDFEMHLARLDSAIPFVQMDLYGPIRDNSPDWHQAGPGGERDLMPFEQEILDLMIEAQTTTSLERRYEIFQKVLEISTRNIYSVGVYEVRRGTGIHKRIRNYQPDIPPYLYNWTISSIPVQILYVEKENQFDTRFSSLIPTKESYLNTSWNR